MGREAIMMGSSMGVQDYLRRQDADGEVPISQATRSLPASVPGVYAQYFRHRQDQDASVTLAAQNVVGIN
eukprot:27649-Eustigmatos_ZCMA.PRE.1